MISGAIIFLVMLVFFLEIGRDIRRDNKTEKSNDLKYREGIAKLDSATLKEDRYEILSLEITGRNTTSKYLALFSGGKGYANPYVTKAHRDEFYELDTENRETTAYNKFMADRVRTPRPKPTPKPKPRPKPTPRPKPKEELGMPVFIISLAMAITIVIIAVTKQ